MKPRNVLVLLPVSAFTAAVLLGCAGCRTSVPPPSHDPAWRPPPQLEAALYGSRIFYAGSEDKRSGWNTTAYARMDEGRRWFLEGGISHTELDYKNLPDLREDGFTLAWSRPALAGESLSVITALHYTQSTDELTDGGINVLADLTAYESFRWDLGLEGVLTRYHGYGETLHIYQLAPHTGFYLLKPGPAGTLYTESRLHYIRKDEEIYWSRDAFTSFEQKVRYYYGGWDVEAAGWIGERLFAVTRGGFLAFTTPDRYKGGWGVGVGRALGRKARIGLEARWNRFESTVPRDAAQSLALTVNLGFSF